MEKINNKKTQLAAESETVTTPTIFWLDEKEQKKPAGCSLLLRLPCMLAELQQMIVQLPLGLHRHLPPVTRQAFRIAQLDQNLQLVVRKSKILVTTAARLFDFGDDGIGPGRKELKELCATGQSDVRFNVLQVLLEDEHVQLHAFAAMGIHGSNLAGVRHEHGIDKDAEAGDDESG